MKPIVFFDLETTGTNVLKDRIVEIAMIRLEDGNKKQLHSLINPEIPIPQAASDVHGITDEKVAEAPTLKTMAPLVAGMIDGADLAGFNSNNFDIPLLYAELHRVGHPVDLTGALFVDACTIFKRKEERTLSAAVKHYLGRDHEGAHGAMADVEATIEVFKAQRSRYDDVKAMSRADMALFSNYDKQRVDLMGRFALDADGEHVFTFGKHKDRKAKYEREYLQWMLGQEFLADTKAIIRKILCI